MEIAKVNGIRLAYEITGSGEPVLFIEPLLKGAFQPLLTSPALRERYKLIRFDKRGWGESTHTDPPVRIETYAEDAGELLRYLGVRKAHVVGHSSGGAIALQLALDRPEMVHSLVLLEPALLTVPGAQLLLDKAGPAMESFRAGDYDSAVAVFLSVVSGLDWSACRAAIESQVPGALASTIAEAETFFSVELPALSEWSLSSEMVAQLSQPVLSVRGTQTEQMFVETSDYLRAGLTNVEEFFVETGHLLQLQQPDRIARRMNEFFGRHRIKASSVGVGLRDVSSP